jgi:acyl-CoA dehydrogenase
VGEVSSVSENEPLASPTGATRIAWKGTSDGTAHDRANAAGTRSKMVSGGRAMLGFELTTEQSALQQRAREFALAEVLPAVWWYDERDRLPSFLLEKAFRAGLMNVDLPVRYGGRGLGLLECALVSEEIAAACPGFATSLFDNSLGMNPLLLSGHEAAREKYLPEFAKSFKLICFATSEATTGSDVAGIRCLAAPDGDGYVLNGSKYWITNGGVADYFTVFATVDPKARHAGICAFLLEKGWEGVRAGVPIPKLGQRCSNTVGLHFRGVRVPKENVLAHPGEGFALAMKTFARTRPAIGAFAVGAARSALEIAVEYAKKRRAFGAPIASFQAIELKLAEMYQKVETSRLLTWKAAWEADAGKDPSVAASIAKFYASEAALQVVSEALQILGGFGYTKLSPLEKFLRDVRLLMLYEGTSEIQRLVVAEHVLEKYAPAMPPLESFPLLRELDLADEGAARTGAAWRCRVCGYVHYGEGAPEECPSCFYPKTAFGKLWPPESPERDRDH